jgi:hypothetical protein
MPSFPPLSRKLAAVLAGGVFLLFIAGQAGGRHDDPRSGHRSSQTVLSTLADREAPEPRFDLLAPTARRFARAFLRYEGGRPDRRVRAEIKRLAAPALGWSLLRSPPRLTAPLPPARHIKLLITAVSRHPLRALAHISARRGRRLEGFSFLFEYRDDRWLARGLGD